MDSFVQDIRYAIRSLRGVRSTTLIAVACLGLGIGANTALFSVVRAVLLEALPYGDAARLVQVGETENGRGPYYVSPANFLNVREQRTVFEDLAAWTASSRDLAGDGEPERLRGVRATANLFMLLDARPVLGRVFLPSDT